MYNLIQFLEIVVICVTFTSIVKKLTGHSN